MRLLHAHAGNLFGGVESMLLALAREGPSLGVGSEFALCYDARFRRELAEAGASVALLGEVRLSRPWRVATARRRFAELLRRDPPDFVLCHSAWSQVIFGPPTRAAGRPLVRWFHAAPGATDRLERWARRTRPELAICNSQFTADALARVDPGLAREIIYPPVPPPAPAVTRTRSHLRSQLGITEETVAILQVGRMERGKGHGVLLEALARLTDRSDWVAWQAGGAQRRQEAEYLGALGLAAARLGIAGRVRFLGEREDARALYAAADVYCQPNTSPESFGVTFVEALYARLPVVTSDIGGAREIVNADCGILIPPADPDTLAVVLRRLLSDPGARQALAAAGPARAGALCDPATQVKRLLAALSEVHTR